MAVQMTSHQSRKSWSLYHPGLTGCRSLISKLVKKPSASTIRTIIKQAVECEQEFVSDALPVSLLGMNAEQMLEYIQFVADRLAIMLGIEAIPAILYFIFLFFVVVGYRFQCGFWSLRVLWV